MKVLRIVSVLFLVLYAARIVEAAYLGVGLMNLLPYAGGWFSWVGLASWQVKGVCYVCGGHFHKGERKILATLNEVCVEELNVP